MTADHAREGLSAEERAQIGLALFTVPMEPSPDNPLIPAVERILTSRLAALRAEHDGLRERVEASADVRTDLHHPTAGQWCSCGWIPDPVPLNDDGSGDADAMEEMARVHRVRALLADGSAEEVERRE